MRINDITAIARPLEPKYPTNRAIGILSMVVAMGGTIFQLLAGATLIPSAVWGFGAALGVFLTWALGRELDPDHDLSAFVAAGLALVGILFLDLQPITPLLWMLLVVRIVNRTTGLPARILDSLLILGLAGWLALQGNWTYGLVAALAFLLDSQLPPPHRRQLPFAGLALVITLISFILNERSYGDGRLSLPAVLAVLVMSALSIPVIVSARRLRSVSDQTNEPLNPRRVQAAQVIALLTVNLVAWLKGTPGVVSLISLWAAMVGASLYKLLVVVYRSVLSTADD